MEADLRWYGFPEVTIKETLKNATLTAQLLKIADLAKSFTNESTSKNSEVVDNKQKSNFLYQLATKLKPQCHHHVPIIIKNIMNANIRNESQFKAATDYVLSKSSERTLDEEDFKQKCGAGIVVTAEEIEDKVKAIMEKHRDAIIKERYSFNVGKLLGEVREVLPWADGAAVKHDVDMRLVLMIGPKTEEELNPKTAQKSAGKIAEQREENSKEADESAESIEELLKNRASFHKVGENYKTDGYVVTPKTMSLLQAHVKAVDGKITTRFPPEPNGILHIGHAKAININFGAAKAHGGRCILRFDDTNPEKEEEKFFTAIEDAVKWLGYKPYKITHSSDYFDQLYKWAIKLIEKGLAYVCHQSVEEMRGIDAKPSTWRDRPMEDSLHLFQLMKNGVFDEGHATLRLKMTLEEGKMDPVAYRIKFVPHHRTKDKWCIYPTYDYTHCLCDSLENITHSLCTKEFQSRRSSYYWLCNALDIYCPVQWEYARLNMNYTVVSKRKILKLVDAGVVKDWDDPRLFTLPALRRRGIPAEAINAFVAKLGLTVAQTAIDPSMLDAVVRDYLNNAAPRTMAVLEPLRVFIENYAELGFKTNHSLQAPQFPSNPERTETFTIAFGDTLFIDSADYRENAEKSYRRLTHSQPVGLKHIGVVIYFKEAKKNDAGTAIEIIVRGEKATEASVKPKAFIHWVARPAECEVRLYEPLFKHKNPEDTTVVPEGFLSDCNENTLKVVPNALIDANIAKNAKEYDRFQFERTGYFCVDKDSTKEKLVFNRTLLLKEDAGKI
ncbi:tRNA synthetases class I (E and q), catalytic domain-containing protein [Ditylenchus destructor]|uniref:Probable glutamine--tRNA ligase n=1 Tax=Ditylenchus destructor TaxID=166010 RepID=A0AAD4R220_9BILA|nr:tRNA synthetases class I (E and q), catalytic domain-containing protein [Ditylenchus destructor]